MATTLLGGIARETVQGTQGGLLTFYATELSNITGTTSVSAGVATLHTGASVWKQYVLGKESGSNFTSTYAGNVQNGSGQYEQVLTAIFKRNSVSKRNELKVMGQNELVVVINDNDQPTSGGTTGNLYVIGLRVNNDYGGVNLTSGTVATGAQFADSNNMTVTLRALESHPPLAITAADYVKIVAGTAV